METYTKSIPESELHLSFSRSSGRGGQNVNKVSTRVEIRWNVGESNYLREDEKRRILEVLEGRINKEGELIVVSQKGRTQAENRRLAAERLNALVSGALKPQRKRIPTKPTKSSIERRIREKKMRSERKKMRSEVGLP